MGFETVNDVVTTMLSAVDWRSIRSMSPSGDSATSVSLSGGSADVPLAVEALLRADTEAEVRAAYWRLDNVVVVQGQLFEAAEHVIAPLLAGLHTGLRPLNRMWLMELLVQIGFGDPHRDEVALGNTDLRTRCIAELKAGLSVFYSLLGDSHPLTRLGAVDLVDLLDPRRDRVERMLSAFIAKETDPKTRSGAAEILARLRST